MLILISFAFLSGIITVLSPCILPVLPIVLTGSLGNTKARPLGIISGFIISFAFFTLSLSAIVRTFKISPDYLRLFAVSILIILGFVLLLPGLKNKFQFISNKIANIKINKKNPLIKKSNGFTAGFFTGISLGLVWTPCAGPIMASVISLALSSSTDSSSLFITLAYTVGTAIPLFAIMLGGRKLLNKVPSLSKNTAKIQKIFGVIMIVVGISIGLGWERRFQASVLKAFPEYGTGLTKIEENNAVKKALENRKNSINN